MKRFCTLDFLSLSFVRVQVLLNLVISIFFSRQTLRCSGFLAIVRNQSPLLSLFLNWMPLQLEPQCWQTHSPLPKKSSISKRSLFLEQPHRKLYYQRTRRSLSECGILRGQRSTLISATDARTRRHWSVMQWLDNDREGSKNICIFFRSASAEGRTDNNCSADCPCNLPSLTHQESQDRLHGPVKRARPSCCCCICLHQPRFRRPSSTTCAVSSAGTESINRYVQLRRQWIPPLLVYAVNAELQWPPGWNCCFHLFKPGPTLSCWVSLWITIHLRHSFAPTDRCTSPAACEGTSRGLEPSLEWFKDKD